jgi:acyl carrier protein
MSETNAMENLIEELKTKIVKLLYLSHVNPAEIKPGTPLFGGDGGLGLDSIDALEIVIMIEQEYGVKIENKEVGKTALVSFETLAAHIVQSRQ